MSDRTIILSKHRYIKKKTPMIKLLFENKIIVYCLTALGYVPACIIGLSLESYTILAFLILVDVITGITASIYIDGFKAFKSSRLSGGLLKKSTIIFAPFLILIAGGGMEMNLLAVSKMIMGGFIASETFSILGNFYSIHTKEKKPEFDGVVFILKKVMDIFKSIIKNIK